jgi:chromosome segregation ATPase
VSTVGSDSNMLEGLYRQITSGYEGAIKGVQTEQAAEFKSVRAEMTEAQKAHAAELTAYKTEQAGLFDTLSKSFTALTGSEAAARAAFEKTQGEARGAFETEQRGVLAALSAGLDKTIAKITRQITAITKRVTGLETTTQKLSEESKAQEKELAAQAKNITGVEKTLLDRVTAAVAAEEKARKGQAQLVADTSRIAAARAAGFTNLLRWGTSQSQQELDRTIKAVTGAYDLNPQEVEQVRTFLQSLSNSLSRGEYGGTGGLEFLTPILPGPMGYRVASSLSGAAAVHAPSLSPTGATMKWGIH